jgi:hypothetical protein
MPANISQALRVDDNDVLTNEGIVPRHSPRQGLADFNLFCHNRTCRRWHCLRFAERPNPQGPRRNLNRMQQAIARPGILGKAGIDFVRAPGPYDQQNILRSLQRPGEQHETLGVKAVHEFGVGVPLQLFFQRA